MLLDISYTCGLPDVGPDVAKPSMAYPVPLEINEQSVTEETESATNAAVATLFRNVHPVIVAVFWVTASQPAHVDDVAVVLLLSVVIAMLLNVQPSIATVGFADSTKNLPLLVVPSAEKLQDVKLHVVDA